MSVSIYYVTSEFLRRGRITYDDITQYLAEQSENPSERPLIFDLMVDDFRIKEANFHTFTWEKTATEKRYGESVKAFTKQPATYETTLMLQGSEQYRKDILNKLHNAIEADVINGSPGRIYWESYFIECYIVSSETSPAEGQSPFVTENKLSIYCPYPFWTREVSSENFSEDEGMEEQEDLLSVRDFMTIGVIPISRTENFYVNQNLVSKRGIAGAAWSPSGYAKPTESKYDYCSYLFYGREDGAWDYTMLAYYPYDGTIRYDTIRGIMTTEQINPRLLWTKQSNVDDFRLIDTVYSEDLTPWSLDSVKAGSDEKPLTMNVSKDGETLAVPVSGHYVAPKQQSAEAGIFGPAACADFPYDFLADPDRNLQIENDSAYGCNWEVEIKGPVNSPVVTINDTMIGVEGVAIPENASLLINSKDKTILLQYPSGERANFFGYRVKSNGNYVFDKIPPGVFTVMVNDAFAWSLTLFDERSEPKWTV